MILISRKEHNCQFIVLTETAVVTIICPAKHRIFCKHIRCLGPESLGNNFQSILFCVIIFN
jgi:hypothetical protein